MNKALWSVLLAGLLLGSSGCIGTQTIAGHNMKRSMHLFGHVRIIGHNNDYRVTAGSRISKLSIMGDANVVTVEQNVTLNKIEFWGHGNTVSVPAYLVLRSSEVGTNQIVRREGERPAEDDWMDAERDEPMLSYPDTYRDAEPDDEDMGYTPPPTQPEVRDMEPSPEPDPLPPPEVIDEPAVEEEEPDFRPPPTLEPVEPEK